MITTTEDPVKTFAWGHNVTLRGQWQTAAGEYTDPDTVTVEVKSPDEVIATYEYVTDVEVVKEAVGKYKIKIVGDQEGTWYHRWSSTDTDGDTAWERSFVIARSQFNEG